VIHWHRALMRRGVRHGLRWHALREERHVLCYHALLWHEVRHVLRWDALLRRRMRRRHNVHDWPLCHLRRYIVLLLHC
jgi:hypothetical protein